MFITVLAVMFLLILGLWSMVWLALIMLHFQFISHPIVSSIQLSEMALLKVQSDILPNMDKHELTLLVLLDLSVAFDTVDHKFLINILESDFGICGDVLKWFRSYLTERVHRVIVNQQSSKTFHLNYGVPQGSCLELFSLHASRLFAPSISSWIRR